MRVGNFSAVVPQGTERETGHVRMRHGEQYSVRLMSHVGCRSDATLEIDGKEVGVFRLPAYGQVEIETHPDDAGRGKFTFYRLGSRDAADAGLGTIPADDMGLIKVTFRPERKPQPPKSPVGVVRAAGGMRGQSAGGELLARCFEGEPTFGAEQSMSFSPGGTGLSGYSTQRFVSVESIEYDPVGTTVVHLRLVAADNDPRELPRALPSVKSNPVPKAA